ncbi:MAG: hypothetical protein JW734_02345 [Candidatus Omnitrophica bacterium]|nr:hypothetical protein [Candidatus Omnitrophota bacterium]
MRKLLFLAAFAFCILHFAFCNDARAVKVEIKSTPEKGYKLIVDGQPFLVKGVVYHPVPPGSDYNYDFWQDLDAIDKDAKLLKEAGFNVVRLYVPSPDLEKTKKVIRQFYKNGIYTVMGHWVGFWNYPCPFYGDEKFREEVKKEVLEMVEALKDEEGLLMWILGNENNYSFSGKVNPWPCPQADAIEDPSQKICKKAEIYYSLMNDISKGIKEIDQGHPVALGNGELITLDIAAKYAKDVDLLALIFYRGKRFGNIFNSVKSIFDKPVLIAEMGCDAYDAYRNKEDQDIQAEFLLFQWLDIYKNTFERIPEGNCLGGIIFEWNDEWWKYNPSDSCRWVYHDTLGGWSNGSYYFDIKVSRNLNMNEEWFGITAFSKDEEGTFLKKPRKAYYVLRDFFASPQKFLEDE